LITRTLIHQTFVYSRRGRYGMIVVVTIARPEAAGMPLAFDYRPSADRTADRIDRERLSQLAACYQLFVGHELPNTLVSLQGLARLLAEQGERLDDGGRSLLDRLAVLAQRADVTSRRLAEFGRLLREPAVGHPIDPAEVIREAVAEINARLS